MKPTKIYIGIDPGNKTGVAVWNSDLKQYTSVGSMTFWKAIDLLTDFHVIKDFNLKVVIEDPNINKPVFLKHLNRLKESDHRIMMMIAQKVGMNKRDAQLIIDFCEYMKIPYATVRPVRKKLKADAFKALTKYEGRTNEHGRDAGMLVYGM